MGDITFKLLHPPKVPCPNTASPLVEMKGRDVHLSYDCFLEGSARLKFFDVFAFRIGSPNDEGFYGAGNPWIINDSIYNSSRFPSVSFWEFYEVYGFDWSEGLVGEEVTFVQPELKSKREQRHFVFFMKDGTFECVCKDWVALA